MSCLDLIGCCSTAYVVSLFVLILVRGFLLFPDWAEITSHVWEFSFSSPYLLNVIQSVMLCVICNTGVDFALLRWDLRWTQWMLWITSGMFYFFLIPLLLLLLSYAWTITHTIWSLHSDTALGGNIIRIELDPGFRLYSPISTSLKSSISPVHVL